MVNTSYTKILDHLYMGGITAHYFLKDVDKIDFENWICCICEEEPAWNYADNVDWLKIDDIDLNDKMIEKVEAASDWAAELIKKKQNVLITCWAGLNRSGLVTALTLLKLGVKNPIEILREKRDPYVLCNDSFENYVRDRMKDYNTDRNNRERI